MTQYTPTLAQAGQAERIGRESRFSKHALTAHQLDAKPDHATCAFCGEDFPISRIRETIKNATGEGVLLCLNCAEHSYLDPYSNSEQKTQEPDPVVFDAQGNPVENRLSALEQANPVNYYQSPSTQTQVPEQNTNAMPAKVGRQIGKK